jgi:diamine N-acetyltransferase
VTVIHGNLVQLRPARKTDRRAVYSWLAESDVTSSMLGLPLYPDVPPPTWEEFCADYGSHFFDDSAPEREASYIIEVGDEAVGHVNYEIVGVPPRHAELDIWMRSERDTGRGWGSDALGALMAHLHSAHGVPKFVIRPSARNRRAIGAYQKAGFTLVPMTTQEQAHAFGPGDYDDNVVLVREFSA